jgi:hypothetical protein
VKSLISLKLQRDFDNSVPRWTSKKQKQKEKMGMHADELQFLKKKQINTLRILDVLEVKCQHFDLLQWEFRHFLTKSLLCKGKMERS